MGNLKIITVEVNAVRSSGILKNSSRVCFASRTGKHGIQRLRYLPKESRPGIPDHKIKFALKIIEEMLKGFGK